MGRHSSGERRSRLEQAGDVRAGTVEDLRLLVSRRGLWLTSLAAVVLIFVLYFVVLVALGRQRDWLLLLIIPAGLAGVAVGALLDRAHKVVGPVGPVGPLAPVGPSADSGDAPAEEADVADQAEEPELAGGPEDEGQSDA